MIVSPANVALHDEVAVTQNYTSTFSVDATPQEAFDAIVNVRGWWSEDAAVSLTRSGASSSTASRTCTVRGSGVTDLVPEHRVAWHVVDNYFNFIADQAEWTDTDIIFEIFGTDSGAEIRFTHVGLVPQYECYDVCSNAWAGYLTGSLRNLINTGVGQPNPAEGGDAPAHQDAATEVRVVSRQPASSPAPVSV